MEPTATACAAVFAASADRAGVPGNREPLAAIGADFGRLAHLLDAVDDRAADRVAGDFNPLDATGTTDETAVRRAGMLAENIVDRYEQLVLHDDRLLRALLVGGVARAVRARRKALTHRMIECGAASAGGRTGWPASPPPGHRVDAPWPPPFKPNRRWYERILPFTGVSCCGPALCTDHWNHCSDKYKSPACEALDCGCDACDCCCCCD